MLYGLRITEKSKITDQVKFLAGTQVVSFLMVRAQGLHDGRLMDDQDWSKNRTLAMNSDLRWGAIMDVVYATEGAPDPWAQAQNFMKTIDAGGRNWQIPPVIWCEEWAGKPLPGNYAHLVMGAVDVIQSKTGRKPILASNLGLLQKLKGYAALDICPKMLVYPVASERPPMDVAFWDKYFRITNWPASSEVDIIVWPGSHTELKNWCMNESTPLPKWSGDVQPGDDQPGDEQPGEGEMTLESVVTRMDTLIEQQKQTNTALRQIIDELAAERRIVR